MRTEHIGDTTLYLGDCREIMTTLGPVDSVVTDPVWPNVPKGAIAGWEDPYGLWASACSVMPAHKRLIVILRSDSDPRFLAPVSGRFFRTMHLPYVMPGYIGRILGGDEIAYWFGDPIAFADGRRVVPGRGPLVQPGGRPANGHPMSRAQAHMDWLVKWCSDEGETVLDPFMGSGTTGIACAKLGRKFIGIEIEPKYFDIACRRIEEAYRQADLFIEPPKPRTEPERSLLDELPD